MKLRALIVGAATAAFLAIPTIAMAAWGQVTGNVNMRSGPSVHYPRILTLPAGAQVWINGSAGNGWLSVSYGDWSGYVSGSYVAGYAPAPPGPVYRPPPPTYGYYRDPWWDERYHAWYDGSRWYYDGAWYASPGFYFGFSFGN